MHIPNEWRQRIDGADPLSGLNKTDVESLINNLANQQGFGEVSKTTLNAIWAAATSSGECHANPLYLRFLGDDILDGTVDLTRAETIPKNLDSVFERAWMGLPPDHDYAIHQMLGTLAILRQYGTDELMQYVVNENRPQNQALSIEEICRLRMSASKLLVYQEDRFSLFHDKFREFLIGPHRDQLETILEISALEN
jgi:hypothetical protein